VWKKRVPCQKVGREWRFLRRGLEQWLAGEPAPLQVAEDQAPYGQEDLFEDVEAVAAAPKGNGFGDTAFTKNRREPLHRWAPWVAGFSAAFVEGVFDAAISGDPREVQILDPFAGVGTTLVEGLKRGYNVAGFEINPYAALVCETKLGAARCSLQRFTNAIRRLDELKEPGGNGPVSKPPERFRSKRPFFSPAIEQQVLRIQDFIAGQSDKTIRNAFQVALGAVMVSFSNYSYEPSLSTRLAAGREEIEHADVLGVFREKLWEMEADIGFLQRHMKRFDHRPATKVHRMSYLHGADALPDHSVDALITSPPYLNNYHYVRNTRPQLYWLDLIEDNADLKTLEQESFGCFWQTVRQGPRINLEFAMPELEALLEAVREQHPEKGAYGGEGWANYAAAYFNDCERFFKVTRRIMKPGGLVVVVIGNNIVQGIHIETDRLLAEIGEQHGFTLEQMHQVRKKRTGSSIVNSSVRVGVTKKRTELYETAVELRAPR
jgi:DNA modification methylase